MKRLLIGLVVFLSVAPLAHADDASRRAKVEQLLSSMHLDRMMDQMMTLAKGQAKRQFQASDLGGEMTDD